MSVHFCSATEALQIYPLINSMYPTVGNTVSTDSGNTSRDEHPPIASWSASLYAWVRASDRFYCCCQRLHDFRLRVCLGCRDFEQILKLELEMEKRSSCSVMRPLISSGEVPGKSRTSPNANFNLNLLTFYACKPTKAYMKKTFCTESIAPPTLK